MATKRTPLQRGRKHRITDAAIAAWKRCDGAELQRALGLRPSSRSPLPYEITCLGTAEWEKDTLEPDRGWDAQWQTCIEIQRELLKIAGWPDCRRVYEHNLKEAEECAAYEQSLVDNPTSGGMSHGDPKVQLAYRKRSLARALEQVAWRKQLLEELEN